MRYKTILLWLSLSSTAAAQTVDGQIRAEVSRYVHAINRGDPQAVAALYLKHAETSSLGDGHIYRGWQVVADLVRDVYSQVGTIQMTVDSVSVLPLGPSAALAVMRFRWVLGPANPGATTGAMTLLYMRTPEGWRVVHDHTSTLAPSTSVPGPTSSPTHSGPARPVRQTVACAVARIVDGDTIECTGVGRIRLIGRDAPELSQAPFGVQAASALAAFIPPGAEVQLEQDVEARDRYGRLLAYAWLDGRLVNWRMIREGWALVLTYPPNVQYVDWFTDAQQRAREEVRGLWSTGGFDCPPVDRRRGRCA